MVAWPGVALWQTTLTCPLIWLILRVWQTHQVLRLGRAFDRLAVLLAISLILNPIFAEFHNQARWQAWAAFCGLVGLYALWTWINTNQRYHHHLILFQVTLSSLFIASSLIFWITEIALPELAQIQELQSLGISASVNFSAISLRNWYPLGHQNYVAGYLILALPLLFGVGLSANGWVRWLCLTSFSLGVIDLYTTNSRGGALCLGLWMCLVVVCWLLKFRQPQQLTPKRTILGVAGLLVALTLLLMTNSRLNALGSAVLRGQVGGELAYRLITNVIGWRMGASHVLTGVGLGGVPLTYQKYRPYWAGQEAELAFQLHSTPAQLWGELGIAGILLPLGFLACLSYYSWKWVQTPLDSRNAITQSLSPVLVCSLLSGLVSYCVFSLTDYQLDNLGIGGLLIVYIALILFEFQQKGLFDRNSLHLGRVRTYQLVSLSVGGLMVVTIWLLPIHHAWKLSSEGFSHLGQGNVTAFVDKLEAAHRRAPWEPYYAYQLGWNFGNLAYQESNPEQQTQYRALGIRWLQSAQEISPYQEFGYSNLGWLLVNDNAEAATQAFAASAKLTPAKKGIFFGLGYSLLNQGEIDLALNAWLLEILRQPILLTSPIWQSPQLQPLYPRLLRDFERYLTGAISQTDAFIKSSSDTKSSSLQSYWQRLRGNLYWWQGSLEAATQDWIALDNIVMQTLLKLTQKPASLPPEQLYSLKEMPSKWIFLAWQETSQRQAHLARAWLSYARKNSVAAVNSIPEDVINDLYTTMNAADSFDDWLRQKAPVRSLRNARTGFGSLSRHVDGPNPEDFLPRQENLPITHFFNALWSSSDYSPELERALQPIREKLLAQLAIDHLIR